MKKIRHALHTIADHILTTPKQCFAASVVILLIAFGSIGYIGYAWGTANPETVVIKGVTNIENESGITANFSTFWQAWKLIKQEYLKGEAVKEKELMYGAIDGIVRSLGDPNTNFFPPAEAKQFEETVKGSFGGIGAEIGIKENQLIIIAPLKDSPAERAGIRSGDKIFKIDDHDTANIKIPEAVGYIRGVIGTKVKLLILHEHSEKPEEITITRETIKIPTLDYKVLDGHIGYIQLKGFNQNAESLFSVAVQELHNKKIGGLILDLRDNPGGYLEIAVNLAGWFLPKGDVVAIQEFRGGTRNEFRAYGPNTFGNIPVVVLINQGSASASEILAGALHDNRNAKLVGIKTFGKGTVQELKPLRDGSTIKLTIAHWLTPKGTLIDKNGINPDYEVKIEEKDIKAKKDPQLEKALLIIKKEIGAVATQ